VTDSILRRVPVVAGIAYIEHVRRLPSAFTATLRAEPENRYYRQAIAVIAAGEKVGYVAPEIARSYYAIAAAGEAASCPGRRSLHSDHETSGVEVFLDFTDPLVPGDA
jgi:HIRAN domain